eukprot:TRINITY_DN82812_c0_g1_i1.p1 TRINITY_DN82812_c0_g1~~TRINITY_DN82812_c0_g1_i1.p1  ORF type:complete len:122 (+),score=31.10 TRINITY_DN82812_c0_g1_i1:33-398(+)
MSQHGTMAVLAGALVGAVGLAYYLFYDDDSEPPKKKENSKSSVEKLDLDDLDPEERKALEEVSRKGYYHGRPKSETLSQPHRVSQSSTTADSSSRAARRSDFDDFQKKWDRFDDDKFVQKL